MLVIIPTFVLFYLSAKVQFITTCNPNPLQWSVKEKTIYTCLTRKGFSVAQLQIFYNRVFNVETRSGHVSWADQTMVVDCISRQDFLKFGIIPDPPPGKSPPRAKQQPAPPARATQEPAQPPLVREQPASPKPPSQPQRAVELPATPPPLLPAPSDIFDDIPPRPLKPISTRILIDPSLQSQWNEHDYMVYQCLKRKGFSDDQVTSYYNRVLNPITRTGRVSVEDQNLVTGCISVLEFELCGLFVENKEVQGVGPQKVENISPSSQEPVIVVVVDPSAKPEWTEHDKWIYSCLRNKGLRDDQVKAYYNRVLNPKTRSGRVSVEDQNLVAGCITIKEFEQTGLVVEKQEELYIPQSSKTSEMSIVIDPSLRFIWNEHDKWVYQCLKEKSISDDHVKRYYDRVLNPITRTGRVTMEEQNFVSGCITVEEFEQLGLIVEKQETGSQWNEHDKWVYQCLKMRNFSDDQVKSYYDRVLNPKTRTGRVSVADQKLVADCISVQEFEQCGLFVEKKKLRQ